MIFIHREALLKLKDSLSATMKVKPVLKSLRSEGILTRHDVNAIRKNKRNDVQIKALIELLVKKFDDAFDFLIEALHKSDQKDLVNFIMIEVVKGMHLVFFNICRQDVRVRKQLNFWS